MRIVYRGNGHETTEEITEETEECVVSNIRSRHVLVLESSTHGWCEVDEQGHGIRYEPFYASPVVHHSVATDAVVLSSGSQVSLRSQWMTDACPVWIEEHRCYFSTSVEGECSTSVEGEGECSTVKEPLVVCAILRSRLDTHSVSYDTNPPVNVPWVECPNAYVPTESDLRRWKGGLIRVGWIR